MKQKHIFYMVGMLLLFLIFMPTLTGCSPSEKGEVVHIRTHGTVASVSIGFTLQDAADGVIDNPIFTGSVTVEIENGAQFDAY